MKNVECKIRSQRFGTLRRFLRGIGHATIPHSSSLISHSSFFIRHSTFFILHSAFFILLAGCSTTSVFETDKAHPSLEMDGKYVKYEGNIVSPYEVPDILKQHGVSTKTIIHIRVNQLDHLREAQAFRHVLARAGYNRTALVTKEHAEAWSQQSTKSSSPSNPTKSRPKIRYRSSTEE